MKVFTGKVVSKKMPQTTTVEVQRVFPHAMYQKRIKRVKKYHVHDTQNTKVGDTVQFKATSPKSRSKKWEIIPFKKSKKTLLKKTK
jgi:small subunit ribosomal protein S17